MRRLGPLLVVLLVASACGDEPAAPGSRAGPVDDVRVVADPDGPGPRPPASVRLRCPAPDRGRRCRVLRSVPATAWVPVGPREVCTEIFGGPQTARITGRVSGRRVDARFTRRNGCEIARWDAVAPVVEPVLRGP